MDPPPPRWPPPPRSVPSLATVTPERPTKHEMHAPISARLASETSAAEPWRRESMRALVLLIAGASAFSPSPTSPLNVARARPSAPSLTMQDWGFGTPGMPNRDAQGIRSDEVDAEKAKKLQAQIKNRQGKGNSFDDEMDATGSSMSNALVAFSVGE